ncbi:hypothetical protein C404_06580 [Ralstonia sp. AU12-08]|jgi:hypothetical protein|nr:hypothetical protein C404_06580 [Ralstonia sp. AU12-08]
MEGRPIRGWLTVLSVLLPVIVFISGFLVCDVDGWVHGTPVSDGIVLMVFLGPVILHSLIARVNSGRRAYWWLGTCLTLVMTQLLLGVGA